MSPYAISTKKYKIGSSYPCGFCDKRFTIMQTQTGAVLPVEWVDNKRPEGDLYDPEVHISHLLTCKEPKKRIEKWGEVQKDMEQAYWDYVKATEKIMLR